MVFTIHHRHELAPETLEALGLLAERLETLIKQGNLIMSQITDYAAKLEAAFADISGDLTTISSQASAL